MSFTWIFQIPCKGTTKNAHTQESEQKQQELFNMATLSQFRGRGIAATV